MRCNSSRGNNDRLRLSKGQKVVGGKGKANRLSRKDQVLRLVLILLLFFIRRIRQIEQPNS